MHQEKGDFAAGRQFDEQVLAATTKCLGKDHWQSINAQRALETVALLEKLPVADRDQYLRAVALDRNAQCLHAMHDVSAVIAPALEATEVYRRVFGDMHLEYGNSLNALANLYAERGEYSKAEPLYRQAVQISKSARRKASLLRHTTGQSRQHRSPGRRRRESGAVAASA